jgi:hypothetical protein
MGVHIFAEGATILNPGMKDFFKKALGSDLSGWTVSCSGGVSNTIGAFTTAIQDNIDANTDDVLVLVLDSDDYLDIALDRAAHLLQHKSLVNYRFDDLKKRMVKYDYESWQVFFMVQEMEAWFLASLVQVREFFGEIGINVIDDIKIEDVENIEKPSEMLKAMTEMHYDKTGHASIIFQRLDPDKVAMLPHFRLLLEYLKTLL